MSPLAPATPTPAELSVTAPGARVPGTGTALQTRALALILFGDWGWVGVGASCPRSTLEETSPDALRCPGPISHGRSSCDGSAATCRDTFFFGVCPFVTGQSLPAAI